MTPYLIIVIISSSSSLLLYSLWVAIRGNQRPIILVYLKSSHFFGHQFPFNVHSHSPIPSLTFTYDFGWGPTLGSKMKYVA